MTNLKTYGELIHEHLNKLNELYKSMGYTVTEIIIATKETGNPTIYPMSDKEE